MTRKELKLKKLEEEQKFIESLKGRYINSKEKAKFRTTDIWKLFRKKKYTQCGGVDALTGRKLTKTWNCHHERFDSSFYTDLDDDYFLCLNNQMHDLLHICVSETIKNHDFMKKLTDMVNYHIELNDDKDVKDFGKIYEKNKQNEQ